MLQTESTKVSAKPTHTCATHAVLFNVEYEVHCYIIIYSTVHVNVYSPMYIATDKFWSTFDWSLKDGNSHYIIIIIVDLDPN